jgi:hypothetical protein
MGYARANRRAFDSQPRGRWVSAVWYPALRRCAPAIRFQQCSVQRPSVTISNMSVAIVKQSDQCKRLHGIAPELHRNRILDLRFSGTAEHAWVHWCSLGCRRNLCRLRGSPSANAYAALCAGAASMTISARVLLTIDFSSACSVAGTANLSSVC